MCQTFLLYMECVNFQGILGLEMQRRCRQISTLKMSETERYVEVLKHMGVGLSWASFYEVLLWIVFNLCKIFLILFQVFIWDLTCIHLMRVDNKNMLYGIYFVCITFYSSYRDSKVPGQPQAVKSTCVLKPYATLKTYSFQCIVGGSPSIPYHEAANELYIVSLSLCIHYNHLW